MKTTLAIIALVLLAGCDKPPEQWQSEKVSPLANVDGLRDCTYVEIWTGGRRINVVRCPHSDTSATYKQGKTTVETQTVTHEPRSR